MPGFKAWFGVGPGHLQERRSSPLPRGWGSPLRVKGLWPWVPLELVQEAAQK